LSLATSQGRIQLALRNMLDMDDATTQGARVSGLLAGQPRRTTGTSRPAASPGPRQEPAVVEMYRGGTRSIQRF
jgi:Flp pilus assembly protein CpaB